jgi:hypothetical protein
MSNVRVIVAHCPICNAEWDTAGSLKGVRLKTDDVTVCFHCGVVLQVNEDLSLRLADEDLDPHIIDRVLKAMHEIDRAMNRKSSLAVH